MSETKPSPKLLTYRLHITEFVPRVTRVTLSTLQLIGVDLWSSVDIHSHPSGFTLTLVKSLVIFGTPDLYFSLILPRRYPLHAKTALTFEPSE